jgi:LacI family sucrose operon transcriptional repressor
MESGELAAKILMELILKKEVAQIQTLDNELLIRESTQKNDRP